MGTKFGCFIIKTIHRKRFSSFWLLFENPWNCSSLIFYDFLISIEGMSTAPYLFDVLLRNGIVLIRFTHKYHKNSKGYHVFSREVWKKQLQCLPSITGINGKSLAAVRSSEIYMILFMIYDLSKWKHDISLKPLNLRNFWTLRSYKDCLVLRSSPLGWITMYMIIHSIIMIHMIYYGILLSIDVVAHQKIIFQRGRGSILNWESALSSNSTPRDISCDKIK